MQTSVGVIAQSCGWGMHGWDGGWMWLWGTLMMLTWVAVVGGVVWLVVRATRTGARTSSSAREILDERLARGEISLDEYHQRRGLIE